MKGRADYKHSNSGQIFSCDPLLILNIHFVDHEFPLIDNN